MEKKTSLPLIVIPMGDPAGIGPEIVVKALSSPKTHSFARCVVCGSASILKYALMLCKSTLTLRCISDCKDAIFDEKTLNCIDIKGPESFEYGRVQASCGRAAYEYIEKSIELALDGTVDAVATTCINKESLKAAGIPFIGHTEIFGSLTKTEDPLTLFEVRGMRVFFLSRHVSLAASCSLVTKERIIDYVKRCTAALNQLGVTEGDMAVAGLNPHCGEHGLFGREEVDEIIPAINQLQKEGYAVVGPIGADSVFHLALNGRYTSVLSLYHDQGHIATKTLDFERTISITCGMPILRTSVDHGTAFDIAWQNKASAVSMIEAIKLAAKYAPSYNQ